MQIDADKFGSDHHKCRNENVGKNIVEDLLSRLELERLGLETGLNKNMSPIEKSIQTKKNNSMIATGRKHDVNATVL
jgi:hypothetical protein